MQIILSSIKEVRHLYMSYPLTINSVIAGLYFIASVIFRDVPQITQILGFTAAGTLAGVILSLLLSRNLNKTYDHKKYKKLSVISVMLKKQSFICNFQFLTLGVICFVYGTVAYLCSRNIDITVFAIILILFGLIFVRFQMFKQRVLSGSYGTTEEDAREMISFILHDPDVIDGNSGKGRSIITREDVRQIIESSTSEAIHPVA